MDSLITSAGGEDGLTLPCLVDTPFQHNPSVSLSDFICSLSNQKKFLGNVFLCRKYQCCLH